MHRMIMYLLHFLRPKKGIFDLMTPRGALVNLKAEIYESSLSGYTHFLSLLMLQNQSITRELKVM